jgi:ATP-dependent helicase/nuclease subunit A
VTADDGGEADDDSEEGWVPSATRLLAAKLAKQVRRWLDTGVLHAKENRALRPGDIMILVRKRGDLASLLVARLHEEGIPVAGVDRLRLQAPLAVQDLVAAMRFAAQPLDDLNLAALLVSPLICWTQDRLFEIAHGRTGSLWNAVPEGETRVALLAMLNAADNITPYMFVEQLLSGPLQARKRLLTRLGDQARDPVNELLNSTLQFEREGITSLQQFLDAFDRNESDIVRDPGASGDAVRVMTVHGAKGLQAPLVILADACTDPEKSQEKSFKWTIEGVVDALPIPKPRGAERALVASLQAAMDDAEDRVRKEHWRLLYVAMTRAEERLVIAGSLGPRARGEVPPESWHAAVERAMYRLGSAPEPDVHWGSVRRFGTHQTVAPLHDLAQRRVVEKEPPPMWLDAPAPQESRPPRPLAPSSIGADDTPLPPPGAALVVAAERGRLLHALFERLPALPREQRLGAGQAWVAAAGGDAGLVDHALRIIDDPDFAALFAADGLAEAPVAGVVDGIVIAGTIDRMAVSESCVEIVDFKTGRRVPETLDAIPVQHIRQMAAYSALLAGVFPDREIRASLLYSEGPVLHRLPPDLLAAHKPGLLPAKDNFVTAG